MTDLRFEFRLEAAEQLRAASLAGGRTTTGRLGRWIWIPFALPVVLVVLSGEPLASLRFYLVGLAVIAAFALAIRAYLRWQVRRSLASTPELQGPVVYRFTEAGVELSTGISAAQLSWTGVREAVETDDMFLLHFVGNMVYYVPKRVVGDQAPLLRRLLRSRLGSRASTVGSAGDAPLESASTEAAG